MPPKKIRRSAASRSANGASENISFKSGSLGSVKRTLKFNQRPVQILLDKWDIIYCKIVFKQKQIFQQKKQKYELELEKAQKESSKVLTDFRSFVKQIENPENLNFTDLLLHETNYSDLIKHNQKIKDLLEKIDNFDNEEYRIGLHKAVKGLLHSNVDIQNIIVDIIATFIESKGDFLTSNYLNFLIMGPAGVGKTSIAKKIGEIFKWLGILILGDVLIKGKSDLIAEYVGQTAIKTKKLLTDSLENILIIDEAYLLGQDGDKAGYGSEAIGTMVDFLDKNKGQLVVMALGYEKEMQTGFINVNEGINRRFPFKVILQDFSPDGLKDILRKQISLNFGSNVKLPESSIFDRAVKVGLFPNQAGDMENIASSVVTKMRASYRTKLTKEMLFDVIYKYIQNNVPLREKHLLLFDAIHKASGHEAEIHAQKRAEGIDKITCSKSMLKISSKKVARKGKGEVSPQRPRGKQLILSSFMESKKKSRISRAARRR